MTYNRRHSPPHSPFGAQHMSENREPPRRLNPKKLLLSKWTAVSPQHKEKHFLVTQLITPELPDAPLELVELQAVHSRRNRVIAWRELTDPAQWRQGWC